MIYETEKKIRLLSEEMSPEELALAFNLSVYEINEVLERVPQKRIIEKRTIENRKHDSRKGSLNANAKLSELEVTQIIKDYIETKKNQTVLGKDYGVSPRTVSAIVNGERWK